MEAVQNARLVADAERYYRLLYRGGAKAWNVREEHMLDPLRMLLADRGTVTVPSRWEGPP